MLGALGAIGIWLVVLLALGGGTLFVHTLPNDRFDVRRRRSPTRRRWHGSPPAERPRCGSHFSPDPNPS